MAFGVRFCADVYHSRHELDGDVGSQNCSSCDNEGFFATNALLNCARRLLRDAASRFSRIGDVSNGRYPGRLAAKSAIRAISRSANSVAERVLASLNKGVHTPSISCEYWRCRANARVGLSGK